MAKKSGMPTLAKKESAKVRVEKRAPARPGLNAMSAGAANSLPMPPGAGLRMAGPGMKKGGCAGYAKGGSIDGIAQKGKTKGKFV